MKITKLDWIILAGVGIVILLVVGILQSGILLKTTRHIPPEQPPEILFQVNPEDILQLEAEELADLFQRIYLWENVKRNFRLSREQQKVLVEKLFPEYTLNGEYKRQSQSASQSPSPPSDVVHAE